MTNELEWQNFNPGDGPVGTVDGELFKVRFADGSEDASVQFFNGKWYNFIGRELTEVRFWTFDPHRQQEGGFKYEISDFPPMIIEEYPDLAISSN